MKYIIILIIEIFVIIIYKLFSKKQFKKFANIKISLIIILLFNIIFNIYVIGIKPYIDYKLDIYRINEGEIFSQEQEKDLYRWVSYEERILTSIMFGIFSVIIFFILIIVGKILDIIIKKYKDNKIRANST